MRLLTGQQQRLSNKERLWAYTQEISFRGDGDGHLNTIPGSLNTDMPTGAAERRRQPDRGERGDSGKSRAEPRAIEERAAGSRARSSGEEKARSHLMFDPTQQVKQAAGDGGRRAEREGEEEEEWEERGRGKDRSRGDGGKSGRARRAASEGRDGDEEWRRLRWRVNDLEKEKLQLKASHNQEVCGLQAELTRLRSSVERGEAQRVELQYQLTLSRRDAERVAELSRDKRALTERAAELQQTVEELQKALDITRHAREEDQHALQQEVEERERLIQSFSSENQRLHRLLQDQEVALDESERRMTEVQKEREKEAEVKRRRANELKQLMDREERSRREKELLEQRVESLQLNIEAERAAHLETKFNSEIIQLRVRDLEAVVAAERSGQQEAQSTLELLRAQFRQVERAYSQERERSGSTERALERLQAEYEQRRSDMSVALETEKKATSDLSEKLEVEERRHANTHSLLEQAVQRQRDTEEAFATSMKQIRDALQQHTSTGAHSVQPAEHDGKQSLSAEVLQLLRTTVSSYQQRLIDADKQVQDLLLASEKLQGENQTLQRLTSDHRSQIDESQQETLKLKEEVSRLSQESSDWSIQNQSLQAELQREREERAREAEKEREERTAEVQKITEHYHKESTAHLSFLYCLYQRLLAGCVLLDQSQGILGNFTWEELCDVISEQVDQLTSDLRKANEKIAHLQSVCNKKSVCVRELQRSQECVLSRLEESVRRREEEWSRQHTHAVRGLQSELQLCRSQCDSLRHHASSLEQRCSSLTSDLSQLRGLLTRSRKESSSFFLACALLGGALRHAHRRLCALSEQKKLLSRRLAEREQLEEEVRRLVDALGGEKEEEKAEEKERERMRRVVRRWRKSVCVVLAVRRWCSLVRKTTVLFRLERGGGAPAVCVCGEEDAATQEGQDASDVCKGRDGVAARLFRSKRLSCTILTSMSDLQGALAHTGSSPPLLISAACSGLSRLLDHLLDQSEPGLSSCTVDEGTLSGRLRLGLSRLTSPQPDMKSLVSILQQHFLVFSQRLHSAEVERRGLRLEVANLKRGLRKETRMVPDERFRSVCTELRQALSREQEAQVLIQEQCKQLHTLQRRVDTHAAEQAETQRTLSQTTQVLSEARREVSRKERSLRILGKHLSGVQKEKKQVEQRLQRAEDELRDATRCQDRVVSCMKAAEMSCKQFRDSLVQSQHSLTAKPRPLLLPLENLELSGTESIMGAPEVAACQSFLSVVSQLCHTCSSRIDWLEQEVSAHRSHVTALRSELQDACLRDNMAFVPVSEFPESFPVADLETPQPVPLCDLSGNLMITKSPAPSQLKPAYSPKASCSPSSPFCKATVSKTKAKKATKKTRGHVKSGGRK